MVNRYSSRTHKLDQTFLNQKLLYAKSYDRIAGYFSSSIFEVAGEAIESVQGKIRVVCNAHMSLEDVKIASLAKQCIKQEWCADSPEVRFMQSKPRLEKLYQLLKSGKIEVKVLPDNYYGLMHGKAGVITTATCQKVAFLGSINETQNAWKNNYEILWEDDSVEAIQFVQDEFDYFFNSPYAIPLTEFVIEDIGRIANREEVDLRKWKHNGRAQEALVEDPIYRKEFGLWEHQKYFVDLAFKEHKTKGGARLLLADQVGLGKTVQLALAAKLMALYGEKPILIVVPKTLIYQWQEELKTLLAMPSAVWDGKQWIDENGFIYKGDGAKGIKQCPRRVGIISQGLVVVSSECITYIKEMQFECIIVDEAHRARRENTGRDYADKSQSPNKLLSFINYMSNNTKSLLLATATPVQVNPIEAWDLVNALGVGSDKVMGDKFSRWHKEAQYSLKLITGEATLTYNEEVIWSYIRNPFPSKLEDNNNFKILRNQLNIEDEVHVLPQGLYKELENRYKRRVEKIYEDDFITRYNPYIRHIVLRTRGFLESAINPKTGDYYLKKIEIVLIGEDNKEALELRGYLTDVYSYAEQFCALIGTRTRASGFIKTLLLKRLGSSLLAGENTAKKMLSWSQEGQQVLEEYFDELVEDEDVEVQTSSELKNLTNEEIEVLTNLIRLLKENRDKDPKYVKTLELLTKGIKGITKPWKEVGCIIFSQYFDTAQFVAIELSNDLRDTMIGLYAGGTKSGIYVNGDFESKTKEDIKAMVKKHELKVLVGTDAASEGLNLQTLGTLINLDLPWNPTRLEQRKGRIQRIGQANDKVYIYNLRYKGSVEDKVHQALSDRLKDIHSIFGQIPDVLEDVWIDIALGDKEAAKQRINNLPKKHPFDLKYNQVVDTKEWHKCSIVLNNEEKKSVFIKEW